ncbi:hypothetical protein ACWOFR_14690 [Carnobacterium gallinarum]|uniref:hypothetical protein n=1 Tax=Carnobacterium gallinarum TaxID=2749 RepID=UPI0005565109|nr:hypothetical protein [Carnobacterium gallinarum]
MKLDQNMIEIIKKIDFLSHSTNLEIGYQEIKDLKLAEKSINSLKWENLCLEERGKISGYLAQNNKELFSNWNHLVNEIKEKIIPCVEKKLDILILKEKLLEEMKDQIKFDIINIILYKSYSEVIHSDFYETIYAVYMTGYIPCGWSGQYPKGKIKII